MKVIVTGGTGFIGSHVVDILIEKGHDVIIIDDTSTEKKDNINKKAKFYKADITKDIEDIFKKENPKVVFHLAAQVMLRESFINPLFDAKINILGTINVLECCRKYNVKRIIYTSTGGARVGEPQYLPVDEKHPINPLSPYGISKHTAEHYIFAYNYLYGLDYLIFCFGNVYGPGDNPETKRVIPTFIDRMLRREPPIIFGDGRQTRDYIYVIDLAEFIVESMDKNPKHKLFNLANGKQISVDEIFEILKELIRFEKEAKHTETIKGEVKDILLDTSLAEKELGWKPKHDIRRGLKETVRYFKNKSLLKNLVT